METRLLRLLTALLWTWMTASITWGCSDGGPDADLLDQRAPDLVLPFTEVLEPPLEVQTDDTAPVGEPGLVPGVLVLNDESPFSFARREADGSVVLVGPEGSVLSPGQLIYADPGHGRFLGRVITAKKVAVEWFLKVEAPQLDEIFQPGKLSLSAPVDFNGATLSGPLAKKVEFGKAGKGDSLELEVVNIDVSGEEIIGMTIENDFGEPVEVSVKIKSGKLVLQPALEFEADISLFGGLEYLLIALKSDLLLQLELEATVSGELNYEYDGDPFLSLKAPSVWFGWVWVDFGADFSWVLNCNMAGSISATGGMEATLAYRLGAEYTDGQWSGISEKDESLTSMAPQLKAAFDFGLTAGVHGEFFVEPYSIVGPRVYVEPYVRLVMEATANPVKLLWELWFGLRGGVMFTVHFFDHELAEYSTELLNLTKKISYGESVEEPCTGPGCCDHNGQCSGGETECSCPDDCGDPCNGKECGDDGCGGSCGLCSGCTSLCTSGSCGPASQVDYGCDGGDIYWKNSCGTWEDKKEECGAAGCEPGSKTCKACGDGSCDAGETECTCAKDCGDPCEGKECGTDGCGGNCGTCSGCKSQCSGNQCTPASQADYGCSGGDIFWKDSCGTLEGKKEECGGAGCDPGSKICKACGDGSCDAGETKCSCPLDCGDPCEGKECGADGCGGNCGTCSGGKSCDAGKCVAPPAVCGDGTCGSGEGCHNCWPDCGCSGTSFCINETCKTCSQYLGAGWEDKVMFQTGIIPLGKLKNGQVSNKVDVGLFSWFAQQIPYLEASVQDGQQYYAIGVNSPLVKWAMTSPTSTLTPCNLLKAQVWVDLTGASLPAGVYSCNYSITAKVSVKQPGGDPLVSDDSICVSFEVY